MGAIKSEYRWLQPAALVADPDEHRSPRRTTRDWAIDTLCFLIGLGFTMIVSFDLISNEGEWMGGWGDTPSWLAWFDLVLGVALAAALWWRRRWPFLLGMVAVFASFFTVAGAASALILIFTVAVHREFGMTLIVFFGQVSANVIFGVLRPDPETGYWTNVWWGVVFSLITMLWGILVRSRRQLVLSLRDRAERAENEQQLRVAQARALERTRIAREMHDVLAHRISLLSLHAGALEIRPDLSPDEVATAAGVIRASAHQALQDLREVIGVLREDAPPGTTPPERPQPTIADLPALAEESRAAGAKVSLDLRTDEEVPGITGRTAYRIVQEGLTNARKHAPGAVVAVTVAGAPGSGLTIEIRNPWPVSAPPTPIPGTGTGLVGLAERATLAGGRLTHGRTPENAFQLSAWLPWPA